MSLRRYFVLTAKREEGVQLDKLLNVLQWETWLCLIAPMIACSVLCIILLKCFARYLNHFTMWDAFMIMLPGE